LWTKYLLPESGKTFLLVQRPPVHSGHHRPATARDYEAGDARLPVILLLYERRLAGAEIGPGDRICTVAEAVLDAAALRTLTSASDAWTFARLSPSSTAASGFATNSRPGPSFHGPRSMHYQKVQQLAAK
jgi:hypothetical protein